MMGVAYLMSENRKAVNFRTVGVGVGLQILLGFFVFFTDIGKTFFDYTFFLDKITGSSG